MRGNSARVRYLSDSPQPPHSAAGELTTGVRKHAHQWSQLRWASAMGNVQPTTRWTGDASGLRLLLLLLLVHCGGSQAATRASKGWSSDGTLRAMRDLIECVCKQWWTGFGCLCTGWVWLCCVAVSFWSFAEVSLRRASSWKFSSPRRGMKD